MEKGNKRHSIELIIQEINNNNKREMIDKYIGDDEKSRKEFDAYLDVWEKSANLKDFDKIDASADWQKVRSRMHFYKTRTRLPLGNYLVRIAAVLVLAVGLAFFLNRVMQRLRTADTVYTEIAANDNTRSVELEDGTMIDLNKGAKIIRNSDFGNTNRDIILEGEAYFEVARNESLPFKVHSLNSTVEVLGTRFRVKVDSASVIVGVVSGKVALYENENTANRVDLEAENTGYYHTRGNLVSSDPSFDPNSIAWHTHEFIFRRTPFRNVCDVLANYYNLKLRNDQNVVLNKELTMTIGTESLDEVLFTVNKVFIDDDVRLIHSNGDLIVTVLQ